MSRRTRNPTPPDRLVFRWDLDKTYLQSEFETLREMMRIPFEKAEDKVAAPGVAALIRGLREEALSHGRAVRVYFLSASPPQIGRAIRRKLELDGIIFDGIVFKNQLQHIMRGKFRHLREHIGYKLTELLKARSAEPPEAREYLFGDDWESDPLIYSLYADVIAGRIDPPGLASLLRAVRVDPPLIELASTLAAQVRAADAVRRIFINLERRTPPARLRVYGPRLVPCFNYLQTAAVLAADGVLGDTGVALVARSLIEESGYTPEHIANSLGDVARRGHLDAGTAARLRTVLDTAGLLPPAPPARGLARLRQWWAARTRPALPMLAPDAAPIDYRALVGLEMPGEVVAK